VGIKGESDVFIHSVKAYDLSVSEFRENGEISFVLTTAGLKRFRKLEKLSRNNFKSFDSHSTMGRFRNLIIGIKWIYNSLFAIFFDSRLEEVHSFFIINKSQIVDIEIHDYSASPKCKVITFIRKKNPIIPWAKYNLVPNTISRKKQ